MDLKAFSKIAAEADEALARRQLMDAISLTEALTHDCAAGTLTDNLFAVRRDYEAMLRFAMHSGHDDERTRVLNRLFQQVIEIKSSVEIIWLKEHAAEPIGQMAKRLAMQDWGTIHECKTEGELDTLFEMMWVRPITNSEEEIHIGEELTKATPFVQRTIVGSLMLSNLLTFQPSKVRMLLRLTDYADERLQQAFSDKMRNLMARCMTALTLVYLRHQHLFVFYPELTKAIRSALNTNVASPMLMEMQQALIAQALTDQVGKTMDGIIPIMRKAIEQQQSWTGLENAASDEDHDGMFLDSYKLTPEQENLMKKLSDHAREYEEMASQGLDVNFTSFINLKHFAFFNLPSHWFYPYSTKLNEAKVSNPLTEQIMNHTRLCDSDRFSYLNMLDTVNKGRDQFSKFIQTHLGEIEPEMVSDSEKFRPKDFTDFLQSIYRFFHGRLMRQSIIADPLKNVGDLLLATTPLFGDLLSEEPMSETIATLIQFSHSKDAIVLIDSRIDRQGATAWLLQQKGYALMQLQMWQRALSVLQQAQLINEEPYFDLLMARCHQALGQWEAALPLLEKQEKQHPDDLQLTEETGRCLIQMRKWDEAAQRFYKLEYQNKRLATARRAIAWCCLHTGKYDKAIDRYERLISSYKATWEDLLNKGHALWLQGQTVEAIEAYRQFVKAFNKSEKKNHFAHWSEAFREDYIDLLSPKFDAEDLGLTLDAIAME